jgi:hypothetical protein
MCRERSRHVTPRAPLLLKHFGSRPGRRRPWSLERGAWRVALPTLPTVRPNTAAVAPTACVGQRRCIATRCAAPTLRTARRSASRDLAGKPDAQPWTSALFDKQCQPRARRSKAMQSRSSARHRRRGGEGPAEDAGSSVANDSPWHCHCHAWSMFRGLDGLTWCGERTTWGATVAARKKEPPGLIIRSRRFTEKSNVSRYGLQ